MNKKLLALFLALAMVFTLASCGGGTKTTDPTTTGQGGEDTPTTTPAPVVEDEGTYTYREAWSAGPLNWNPHSWEMNTESAFMDYVIAPFVYATFDGEGGWMWAYDAATAVTDITATFPDKEQYGVPADATEKYVYEIKLRPEMKWEDGTPITADDYVESAKRLLDPYMKNYRSNSYTTGESEVANAALYINNDKAGQPVYADVAGAEPEALEGKDMYLTFVEPCVFFGEPAEKYYNDEKYAPNFVVNEEDIFAKYTESGEKYIPFTEDMIPELNAIAESFGDANPEAYLEFLVYDTGEVYEEMPWENVGIVKVDDYTILYILERPLSMFYMMSNLTGNWLVKTDLYDANMKTVEDLKATDYGTDGDKFMSCGPYRIIGYEKDKQIRLERNPHYWAFKDGKFNPENGMYRADYVTIDIVEDEATREQLFLSGQIDTHGLNAEKMVRFKKSDRIYFADETYTARYIFATSLEALQARDEEKGSGCRAVLNNKNFRKALSRSIDRAKYCAEATSGFKPAYFLLNSLYFYDIEHDENSVYRDTQYAKRAVLNLYDVECSDDQVDAEYAKITGRNLDEAKELFTQAYQEVVDAGIYNGEDLVPIEIMVSPSELTPQHIKQQQLMQEFWDEGTAGTPFEGKIKVEFESGDKKRYDNVAHGKNMAIHGAWGGAAFYPFSIIRVYCNPEYMGGLDKIHESNGWNPGEATLEMTINRADGTTVTETRTFADWSDQINGNGEYAEDGLEKLQVLAQLETGILETYQCIPLGTYTSAFLLSYKVDYALDDYHIMYGWGGFRFLEFNYTDQEWAEFVKDQGGTLDYE